MFILTGLNVKNQLETYFNSPEKQKAFLCDIEKYSFLFIPALFRIKIYQTNFSFLLHYYEKEQ
jgi:hypothetical protein